MDNQVGARANQRVVPANTDAYDRGISRLLAVKLGSHETTGAKPQHRRVVQECRQLCRQARQSFYGSRLRAADHLLRQRRHQRGTLQRQRHQQRHEGGIGTAPEEQPFRRPAQQIETRGSRGDEQHRRHPALHEQAQQHERRAEHPHGARVAPIHAVMIKRGDGFRRRRHARALAAPPAAAPRTPPAIARRCRATPRAARAAHRGCRCR